MQEQDSLKTVDSLPTESVAPNLSSSSKMLFEAFNVIPDAVFLFAEDRRLIRANPAANHLQGDVLETGKLCCEMFWYVEGADGCVVDRAIQHREKVEVEIQTGDEGENSISLIVQPLERDSDSVAGALVVARDISDLRRAEAEAIAHKSFIASIADRTPDEIYALDRQARITWMNERAEAYKLLISTN